MQQNHDLINSIALTVVITLLAVEETVGISLLLFANACLDSRERVSKVELAEQESIIVAHCRPKQRSFAYRNEV